jgi:hypothetical protein
MVMRVVALTKRVDPSLPDSHRIRATSVQSPRPMFLFLGIHLKVKWPSSRMWRCAMGAAFWALLTDTRTVREQNSMTGHPLPRTVWMAPRFTVLGEAVMRWAAIALAGRPRIKAQHITDR